MNLTGSMNSARLSCVEWVYNLKHFPADYLPALPALCIAEDLDKGTTSSISMSLLALYLLVLTRPGSTTYFIPRIRRSVIVRRKNDW